MANANRPQGLVPLEYLDGSAWSGKGRMYYIPASDPNAYAIGDPMTMAGSADAAGVASVILATAGTASIVLGSLLGFGGPSYAVAGVDPAAPGQIIIPATKTHAYYVLVTDDPSIVYQLQEGGAGAALTVADVGSNCNLLSGTNNSYVSGWQLDNASVNTGATRQIQLLGLVQTTPGDNAFGAFAKWKVRINYHQYTAGQAGV